MFKHFSLRQWNAFALFELREAGVAEFDMPELAFDMDFPGHYLRLITSVSVTIPCILGPYATVNATLRLLSHRYRNSPLAIDAADYAEKAHEGGDSRFSTVLVLKNQITLSSAVDDNGLPELRVADTNTEYFSFEGAGALSRWRLELPTAFRHFDYRTISDVIVHMKCTSVDGGARLCRAAQDSVAAWANTVADRGRADGLTLSLSLRGDYGGEWHQSLPVEGDGEGDDAIRSVPLPDLHGRLPVFARAPRAKVTVRDVYIIVPAGAGAISAQAIAQVLVKGPPGDTPHDFAPGAPVQGMMVMALTGQQIELSTLWVLTLMGMPADLEDWFGIVRYTYKQS